uniref:Retrotransposon gag domain-containing protein n=1 Tax=Chenopodium quinoa TaxID=63459 RepID=A0A803N919_CHEQI
MVATLGFGLKKCYKYFVLCKIPDDRKVDLASLNMIDKAENWVSSYLANKIVVDWNDFVIDVTSRFKDDKGLNVVEEFNKLQRTSSIESYVDENHTCQFEEPQLFAVEIPGLDVVDATIVELEEQDENPGLDPCISLSALTGTHNYHTMRVKALVHNTILHTLIDLGSTHNFLDIQLAQELGCKMDTIEGQLFW